MPDDDASFRRYVLAELRAAYLRAKLDVRAIAEIGTLVRSDTISPDDALEELRDVGALHFVQPKPPPENRVIAEAMQFFYPYPEDE